MRRESLRSSTGFLDGLDKEAFAYRSRVTEHEKNLHFAINDVRYGAVCTLLRDKIDFDTDVIYP
jgi:hypothetical protein